MRALITGASSGLGRDMARYLATKNIDLILVARDKDGLEKLQNEYANPYGYNLGSNLRRNIDYDRNAIFTNQDIIKNKEYNIK